MDSSSIQSVQLLQPVDMKNHSETNDLMSTSKEGNEFESEMKAAVEQQKPSEEKEKPEQTEAKVTEKENSGGKEQPAEEKDSSASDQQVSDTEEVEAPIVVDPVLISLIPKDTSEPKIDRKIEGSALLAHAGLKSTNLNGEKLPTQETNSKAEDAEVVAEEDLEIELKNQLAQSADQSGLDESAEEPVLNNPMVKENKTGKQLELGQDKVVKLDAAEKVLDTTKVDALDASASAQGRAEQRSENSAFDSLLKVAQQKGSDQSADLQTKIHTPFQKTEWQQAFNQRFMWMVNQGANKALIQLEPAELGPMEVKMQVAKDSTVNVTFTSHSAAVRDTIDSQLNRLREMLAEQGLTLGDVNVDSGQDQQEAKAENGDGEDGDNGIANGQLTEGDEQEPEETMQVVSDRILDTFA